MESFAAPRALIADDQPHVLEALRLLLKNQGISSDTAQSPAAVLERLKSHRYDALLMDLNYTRDTTSGEEGLELLDQVRAIDRTLPVVAMTAWGSVELAIEAMKRGVSDFVLKPWQNSPLAAILWKQIEKSRQERGQLRRQREEMEAERAAGSALLPHSLPEVPGIEIAAASQPLCTLGGDYFDVLQPAGGELAIGIGDVSGKGVPAALLMSNVQASVRALAGARLEPRELTAALNKSVRMSTTSGRFVTFFYGVISRAPGGQEKRIFDYTNAGHCPPILVRADGEVEWLETGGAVLGVFADWSYEQGRIELTPGDRLLFFTDGITETADAREDEFGEERMIGIVRLLRGRGAEEIKDRVLDALAAFAGGRAQDDRTLVVVGVE